MNEHVVRSTLFKLTVESGAATSQLDAVKKHAEALGHTFDQVAERIVRDMQKIEKATKIKDKLNNISSSMVGGYAGAIEGMTRDIVAQIQREVQKAMRSEAMRAVKGTYRTANNLQADRILEIGPEKFRIGQMDVQDEIARTRAGAQVLKQVRKEIADSDAKFAADKKRHEKEMAEINRAAAKYTYRDDKATAKFEMDQRKKFEKSFTSSEVSAVQFAQKYLDQVRKGQELSKQAAEDAQKERVLGGLARQRRSEKANAIADRWIQDDKMMQFQQSMHGPDPHQLRIWKRDADNRQREINRQERQRQRELQNRQNRWQQTAFNVHNAAQTMTAFGGSMLGGLIGAGGMGGGPIGPMIAGGFGGAGMGMSAGFALGGLPGGIVGGIAGGAAGGAIGFLTGSIEMIKNLLVTAVSKSIDIVKEGTAYVVQKGMEYERTLAKYGVLAGGKRAGQELYGQLERLAVTTPYTASQYASGAETLMGYGVSPKKTPGILSQLGDIAGGDPIRLGRLVLAYGQVKSQGRLQGQELRQFAEAGVGAEDFASTMGISVGNMKKMMEEGQVPAEVMEKTIKRLTDEGGRFAGIMKEVNQTVSGQWNAMVETIEMGARRLGVALFEKTKLADLMGAGSKWISGQMGNTGSFGDIIGDGLKYAIEQADKFIAAISPGLRQAYEYGKELVSWLGEGVEGLIPSWENFGQSFSTAIEVGVNAFGSFVDLLRASLPMVRVLGEGLYYTARAGNILAQAQARVIDPAGFTPVHKFLQKNADFLDTGIDTFRNVIKPWQNASEKAGSLSDRFKKAKGRGGSESLLNLADTIHNAQYNPLSLNNYFGSQAYSPSEGSVFPSRVHNAGMYPKFDQFGNPTGYEFRPQFVEGLMGPPEPRRDVMTQQVLLDNQMAQLGLGGGLVGVAQPRGTLALMGGLGASGFERPPKDDGFFGTAIKASQDLAKAFGLLDKATQDMIVDYRKSAREGTGPFESFALQKKKLDEARGQMLNGVPALSDQEYANNLARLGKPLFEQFKKEQERLPSPAERDSAEAAAIIAAATNDTKNFQAKSLEFLQWIQNGIDREADATEAVVGILSGKEVVFTVPSEIK